MKLKLSFFSLMVRVGGATAFGLFLAFIVQVRPIQAATCTFASVGTDDFNTAANWDCGFVPGATSTAVIPMATSTSLSAEATVSDLLINTNATFTTTGFALNVFNNTTSSGALIAGSNTSTFGNDWEIAGTGSFTPGTGTVVFSSSTYGAWIRSSGDLTFNNLSVSTTAGGSTQYTTVYTQGINVTVNGNLNLYGAYFQPDHADFTVNGTTRINSTSLFILGPAGYTYVFTGTTTNQGSISAAYTTMPTLEFHGDLVNSGTIPTNSDGTIKIYKDWIDTSGGLNLSGEEIAVQFLGTTNQTLPAGYTFYDLSVSSTGYTVTAAGNVTTTNSFSLTNGTLALGNTRFASAGTYSNTGGLITIGASGNLVYPHVTIFFADSLYASASSYNMSGTVYISVEDASRNLNASVADTLTVLLTADVASGSDSETVTLTETGAATGIFRGSIGTVTGAFGDDESGVIELKATGTGTITYTDAYDTSDVGTDTATLSFSIAVTAGSGGGGTSSGGSGGGLAPLTTTFQSVQTNPELIDQLKLMGIALHSLVKLSDDKNTMTQDDSAVYYIGSDGKRHAFPNLKSYSTWYADFSGVQVISSSQLASIPLGVNVTYKPGKKMVKFTTSPMVYAVAKGGVLRAIASEQAAMELYGANWNMNIDDISDTFYANYSFGLIVNSLADFNPAMVEASVTFPSDSLQK